MTQAGADAQLRKAREHLLETLALCLKQRVVGIVRGGKVRVHGRDVEIAARQQLRQRALEVVEAQAEAVHAGIDLQMTRQRRPVLRCRGLKRSSGAGRGDRRREVVLEHAVHVADAERAEDENLGGDTCLAEHDGFLDIGARENCRACFLQRERDRGRAVSVRVRFDDADDARGRTY